MQRKYILFIVEGKNDKRVINAMLHSRYFDKYKDKYVFEFLPQGGDITAATENKAKNITKVMTNMILKWRKSGVACTNVKTSDIHEIVQIVDIDGTYIPEENIKHKNEANHFVYEDDYIYSNNRQSVISRNHKKENILYELVTKDSIDNIPYSCYYVSCNMDHLLFNVRNNKSKGRDAENFAFKCDKDNSILEENVFNKEIGTQLEYLESWDEITQDTNSLQRRTNFNLFFSDKAKNPK